MSKIQTVFKP